MMFRHSILFTCLSLLPATLLDAQTSRLVPLPVLAATSAVHAGKAPRSNESDFVLATWLIVQNDNEVALARLALQKAQSKDVKQFAQTMIDAHGQMTVKLQPFVALNHVGDRSVGSGQPSKSDERDGNSKQQPSDASVGRRGAAVGTFDHVSLLRDLGKKCLESATKKVNEKTGAAFDCCYMQSQVMAHGMATDMVDVFITYASPSLRPTLEESQKVLRAHLQHAETLGAQCEAKPVGEQVGEATKK